MPYQPNQHEQRLQAMTRSTLDVDADRDAAAWGLGEINRLRVLVSNLAVQIGRHAKDLAELRETIGDVANNRMSAELEAIAFMSPEAIAERLHRDSP